MGSGKSTIGKKLAKKIGCAFIDTDDELENQYQKEIREIFAHEGEKWFREREEEKINEISNRKEFAVISLGGGALMSEKTLENIKSRGVLIYIQSSPENIYNRIKHSTRRPLMRVREKIYHGKNISIKLSTCSRRGKKALWPRILFITAMGRMHRSAQKKLDT